MCKVPALFWFETERMGGLRTAKHENKLFAELVTQPHHCDNDSHTCLLLTPPLKSPRPPSTTLSYHLLREGIAPFELATWRVPSTSNIT